MPIQHRLRGLVKAALRPLDLDLLNVSSATHSTGRLRALFRHLGINRVLDVGANEGQYAQYLRRDVRYRGVIESFEPLPEVWRRLESKSQGDQLWNTHNLAVGETEATLPIHVAPNRVCSSFLTPTLLLHRVCPWGVGVSEVPVPVRPLDALLPGLAAPDDRIWLKVDTQGYERQVLAGARGALACIAGGQLEVPLQRTYEGSADLPEILGLLAEQGFVPVGVETGFVDWKSGVTCEIELYFARPEPGEAPASAAGSSVA
jgi:FkbM family methyltransferase